jgi:tRNA pseudouridine38-40 synthase
MARYKFTLEYDGSRLVGWQRQRGGGSAQQVLEQALSAFLLQPIVVEGAGRTDSGVHALGQVAHADLPEPANGQPWNLYQLRASINHFSVPHGLSVLEVAPVADGFHARFSALRRHYCYRISMRPSPSVLLAGRQWHLAQPLDLAAMQQGAARLLGLHDFSSFRDSRCQAKSPIRSLERMEVVADMINPYQLELWATARSFLHHQVRIMVGSLVQIGLGRYPPSWIDDLFAARDRKQAGLTAPAEGLYLVAVDYGADTPKPPNSPSHKSDRLG